ncbi:uncharacterized protein ColSpa_09803 [Colletotrichum spaethianum]|uniref:Uncharacterized protein n=1 Tax=Colletotrichum spaethianum TaxID=700344 RepID=A0AA37UQW8_9PEZI|nr:uncharacterized protein ColSpa_09803 [Colletotrichum spaethianum]GKT49622.1 hypothetical protein ColSpa_09803 [Colletotrichum spaethianum]
MDMPPDLDQKTPKGPRLTFANPSHQNHNGNHALKPSQHVVPATNLRPPPRPAAHNHNPQRLGPARPRNLLPQPLPKIPYLGADACFVYTAACLPVSLASDADLATYKSHLPHNVGIALSDGPGAPLHRTEAVNTGVVVDGELEIFLDSGETVTLGNGDRGTIHGWRNASEETVARLFAVLAAADMPVVAGEKLGEKLPTRNAEFK